MEDNNGLFLPPGFRFHPTDEEIITCYLSEKVGDESFSTIAMGEVDLNKCEPWDLPSKAKYGEKEWYFFCQKEKRYPTGTRTNRATESGYWKATGKDKEIHNRNRMLVGLKKTLVFYKGRAPKGEKTNWVMHEFRLEGDNHPIHHDFPNVPKNGWVVVKVFHKKEGHKTDPLIHEQFSTMEDESNQISIQDQVNRSNSINLFGQCKVEPLSNSMVSTSKDTEGLSNDWNNDISSYDDGLSSEPLFDLENIWNY